MRSPTLVAFLVAVTVCLARAAPAAEPEADHGYGAPSSSYGAPSYEAPKYKRGGSEHTHHHYYHYDDYKPTYERPTYERPTYERPSYNRPSRVPQRRPSRYAPNYDDYYYQDGHDPYLHLHKEELARSALLFGVGILKGVAVTALINSANSGITIGK